MCVCVCLSVIFSVPNWVSKADYNYSFTAFPLQKLSSYKIAIKDLATSKGFLEGELEKHINTLVNTAMLHLSLGVGC